MYFDALRALLDEVQTCFGGTTCDYKFFVSLGMPPAECNTISAWWGGSTRSDVDSTDCDGVFESTLNVMLTRCCVLPDGELVFDFVREEKEAECFLTDLYALRTCLECNATAALEPFLFGCAAKLVDIDGEPEKEGGCYSATLVLEIIEKSCCEIIP